MQPTDSHWPDPGRPAIIAPAPHRSYLDGPTIALLTPRPILFAVTPDFACHWIWRPILEGFGKINGCSMTPMRPGSARGLRTLLRHLESGGWVCIFPEGGLNKQQERPGVNWLAQRSGAPVHRLRLSHGPGIGDIRMVTAVRCAGSWGCSYPLLAA